MQLNRLFLMILNSAAQNRACHNSSVLKSSSVCSLNRDDSHDTYKEEQDHNHNGDQAARRPHMIWSPVRTLACPLTRPTQIRCKILFYKLPLRRAAK